MGADHMNKAQALHLFWSSFGIPAIDESSAYDTKVREAQGIDFPYISYEVASANLVTYNQQITGSLWYRSTAWKDAELKAKEIADFIGYGGKIFPVNGGYLRIMLPLNSIIYRRAADPDDSIRRIVFNIAVDFLTAT